MFFEQLTVGVRNPPTLEIYDLDVSLVDMSKPIGSPSQSQICIRECLF